MQQGIMNFWKMFFVFTMIINFVLMVDADLLQQLNFYASQNHYITETFHTSFNMDNVMGPSLEIALQSCQQSFMWQRWNCPNTDFFIRHSTRPYLLDREDTYVAAISTAAILYTITKNCSNGLVAECSCPAEENGITIPCSDNPTKASKLYEKFSQNFATDFRGTVEQHNYKAIKNLIQQSLVKQCGCITQGPMGNCEEEICLNILKPFPEISEKIKQMYDNALQLNNGANTKVLWDNIPLESLLFMRSSPNYCEPEAIPQWNGMRGRQCSRASGDETSAEERKSCQNLCRACGYSVKKQNIVREQHCNCQMNWSFQWECEICIKVERQHYCY